MSAGKERLLLRNDPCRFYKMDVLMKMMRFLRLSGGVCYPATVSDLDRFFGGRSKTSIAATRRHTMWLLKNDLIGVHGANEGH